MVRDTTGLQGVAREPCARRACLPRGQKGVYGRAGRAWRSTQLSSNAAQTLVCYIMSFAVLSRTFHHDQ